MDFFEAQERARKRTHRLVFLFAFAVLGTVLAGYAVTLAQPVEWPGRLSLRKAIAERDIKLAELGLRDMIPDLKWRGLLVEP